MKKMYHPAYVFLQKGNLYIYVTITHSSNITGVMLIKLRKNPNPKDKTDSFRTKKISEDTKDRFGRRHDSWVMDETDDKEIRKDYEASIKKR